MQQAMVVAGSEQPDFGGSAADAPPKQVARAMDRLGRAARLIADVRLGADRLLEAVLLAEEPRQTKRSAHYILEEDASMREHLNDLRTLGRQLEESGVLSGSLKSRGNTWGLHMPLVCPDGAIVAYAWKRQLAGQAGASAVDRTRLALKAFSDQKRRYFPHLEDDDLIDQSSVAESGPPKKIRRVHTTILTANHIEQRSLSAILSDFSNEMSSVRISSYKRTDWLKRASSEALFADEDQSSMDSAVASGQASVVELLVPSVFRAVLSLHPAGSTTPDAIAVFSTDEGGSHVNSRGTSLHKIYQHISEHAEKTLQHFVNVEPDLALPRLLHWMSSYQTLFSETCRKCEKLLINDRSLNLLLPPILRPFQQSGRAPAYHACCYTNDTSS